MRQAQTNRSVKHCFLAQLTVIAIAQLTALLIAPLDRAWSQAAKPELVEFAGGELRLKGFLWKPDGDGPFPALLWNHGSEKLPGTVASVAPYFVERGYVFFVPHRRGQGRSPGPYIMDELNAAGAREARNQVIITLQEIHLQDQLAALHFLKGNPFVDKNRVAVMGFSFGGIQTMLAAERGYGYRVAVNCSGAAETWRLWSNLRARLISSARNAKPPVYLLQAANDHDLTPNRVLSAEMRKLGKPVTVKIFPRFGDSAQEGHAFCVRGVDSWGPEVFAFIETHNR